MLRRHALPAFTFLILAALWAAACERSADDGQANSEPAAEAETPASDDDASADLPSRVTERERDAGSKPQEVMEYLGIGSGDSVADILAGSGYYTYLLSERVGSSGRVFAQGYQPALEGRIEGGDLSTADNIVLIDEITDLPESELDAAMIIRGYHLIEESGDALAALLAALKPGGTVGVVEVRLGREYGHEMSTHRMGERTVIDQFEAAGFDYIGSSDMLRNPDDDHTEFWAGRRHLTDRMLLKFARPGGPAPATPSTASADR